MEWDSTTFLHNRVVFEHSHSKEKKKFFCVQVESGFQFVFFLLPCQWALKRTVCLSLVLCAWDRPSQHLQVISESQAAISQADPWTGQSLLSQNQSCGLAFCATVPSQDPEIHSLTGTALNADPPSHFQAALPWFWGPAEHPGLLILQSDTPGNCQCAIKLA